jgi:hypothetical protein
VCKDDVPALVVQLLVGLAWRLSPPSWLVHPHLLSAEPVVAL